MRRLLLILFLAIAIVLCGCGRVFDRIDDAHGRVRVGIVFDIGGKDDKSFNSASNKMLFWP